METTETQNGYHWSLTLLGIGLIIMFAYYGESVLAVLFFAILLSFMLSPVVQALEYLHLPRAMAALISMVVLLAVLYGVTVASYNQALIFADNIPKYSQKIRAILQPIQRDAEKLEKTGEAVGSPEDTNVVPVRQVTTWSETLTHGAGTLTDILLAASFVPFLAYFLLTWQSHARSATVMLFPLHYRNTAFVTLGLIGKMLQSFIVGKPADRPADFRCERGNFRAFARSVLLLRRLSQRLSEPGSVPGNCAGDGAADPGRRGPGARKTGGGGPLRDRAASFRR